MEINTSSFHPLRFCTPLVGSWCCVSTARRRAGEAAAATVDWGAADLTGWLVRWGVDAGAG